MDVLTAVKQIELRYGIQFKDKQLESIIAVLSSYDTFVVLPTGYGKSRIYFHLPELFEMVFGGKSSVLVISPLIALMMDQVKKLTDLGIPATVVGECQSDKGVAEKIAAGEYRIVFSSPEAALVPGMWRKSFSSGLFNEQLKAVVIDEAHCITEWGGEFRQEYSRLKELRSIFPDRTPFIALTATATKAMRAQILKELSMCIDQTTTVAIPPERDNITYLSKPSKKNVSDLQWLLDDIISNGKHSKKVIVYCRNVLSCSSLFSHFALELKDMDKELQERRTAMFHRSTAETNKLHVMQEFPGKDSNLRVVFATIAFGMGIDIPDVDIVVHWGAPRGLEQYAQESGRGGRDGRNAVSIVYYSGHDVAKGRCRDGVADLCRQVSCSRQILNQYFNLEGQGVTTNSKSGQCKCCSFCRKSCDCGSCVDRIFMSDPGLAEEHLGRAVFSDRQLELLKDNLLDYEECLREEDSAFCLEVSTIDEIVNNSQYLFCEEDIISLGICNHDMASDILLLIEEVN